MSEDENNEVKKDEAKKDEKKEDEDEAYIADEKAISRIIELVIKKKDEKGEKKEDK